MTHQQQLAIGLALWSIFVLNLANTLFLRVASTKEARKIMGLLDDLTAKVHQITSVEGSIEALIAGLKAKIDALAALPTVDPADLAALSAELDSDGTKFASLVTVNTPLDPKQVAVTQGATSSAVAPVTPVPTADPAPSPAPVEALKGG